MAAQSPSQPYRGLSLEQAARKTPPMVVSDSEAMVDIAKMRRYRLQRLRGEMAAREVEACLLTSAYAIRYATGLRDGAIMQGHIPMSYLFVPQSGPTVYFDGPAGRLAAAGLETVDGLRDDPLPLSFMFGGAHHDRWMAAWIAQIEALLSETCGAKARLGVEDLPLPAYQALMAKGVPLANATPLLEQARAIKSPEEVLCMNHAIAVAEDGMGRLRSALRPGVSETELWALLWQANIEAGGDWIEGRLLASGDRHQPLAPGSLQPQAARR